VVVNIFGDDLDMIDAKANEVAKVLKAVPARRTCRLKPRPARRASPCACGLTA